VAIAGLKFPDIDRGLVSPVDSCSDTVTLPGTYNAIANYEAGTDEYPVLSRGITNGQRDLLVDHLDEIIDSYVEYRESAEGPTAFLAALEHAPWCYAISGHSKAQLSWWRSGSSPQSPSPGRSPSLCSVSIDGSTDPDPPIGSRPRTHGCRSSRPRPPCHRTHLPHPRLGPPRHHREHETT